MQIPEILNVNTVFFEVLGYPMSYIEFFGTLLNIVSVFLVAKKNILTWPIGIVAVILFAILFYQIRLYGDFLEQIYYFFTCIYGWYIWLRMKDKKDQESQVRWSEPKVLIYGVALSGFFTILFMYLISNLNNFSPELFPEPASFPFWDALTTVCSFTAMLLMAHKRTECWVYWIVIDIIGVWLYYTKGVIFISMLYLSFIYLAGLGLKNWIKKEPSSDRSAFLPD